MGLPLGCRLVHFSGPWRPLSLWLGCSRSYAASASYRAVWFRFLTCGGKGGGASADPLIAHPTALTHVWKPPDADAAHHAHTVNYEKNPFCNMYISNQVTARLLSLSIFLLCIRVINWQFVLLSCDGTALARGSPLAGGA